MPLVEPSHPYLDRLEPYEPPDLDTAAETAGVDRADLIRLVANENPYGPSPRVADALARFDEIQFHPDYGPLREAVGGYAGVSADQVVLGNGADELIDLLIRLFVEPGEAVVICPPTFSMYEFCAQVNRCRVLGAPCGEDLSPDPDAIEGVVQSSRGEARLLFLVSPGNPGGLAVPLETTERLLELPLLVVVDEAYIEFGGESAAPLLDRHDNLAILRTFSKWAGLAGLRLGYGMLTPGLAAYVERIRPPYNVNGAAVAAAMATFEDLDAVQAKLALLIAERERLSEQLGAIDGLNPLPSQTNFVLVRIKGREPASVVDHLARRGILVRGLSDPAVADCVRITVGRPDQNDAVIDALRRME